MIIKINGKDEAVVKEMDLLELVSAKKLSVDKIVIEHNSRIVPKDEWRQIVLRENDSLEIVSFVGGG